MTIRVLGRHATRSGTAPADPGISGLEWDGNESNDPKLRRAILWDSPFAIYDATYIFRAYPKGPKTVSSPEQRHWTMFFWGNNGNFAWDSSSANTYYGAHPYPFGAPISAQAWEISVASNDFPPDDPDDVEVTWNQWYTQVFRAWREDASTTHHEFYWDYENDPSKVISHTVIDSGWADTNPPSPCIIVGQAPEFNGLSWGGYDGFEEYKGILRGFQFYDALLSLANIDAELATPGSFRTPWYLNLNPTLSDISDKSGSGNHPAWDGSDRPALWTP